MVFNRINMTNGLRPANFDSLAKPRTGIRRGRSPGLALRLALALAMAGAALMPGVAAPPAGSGTAPGPATAPGTSGKSASARQPWGRIVMVGASASAGFTESEPLGGPTTPQYRLSRYLDAALAVPHEPVRNLANSLLYWDPESTGRYQVEEALKSKPTLVI